MGGGISQDASDGPCGHQNAGHYAIMIHHMNGTAGHAKFMKSRLVSILSIWRGVIITKQN
jgi:hypothetical protein